MAKFSPCVCKHSILRKHFAVSLCDLICRASSFCKQGFGMYVSGLLSNIGDLRF